MSPMVFTALLGLVGLAYPAVLLAISIPQSRWAAASRSQLVGAAADAVLALVFVHRLLDWSLVPPLAWLLPVAGLAAGVLAALRLWPELPMWRTGHPPRSQRIRLGVRLGLVALIAVLLLWW